MNDRDGFLRDPDINAQRRHRRRTPAGDGRVEDAYRRPAVPEADQAYRRPAEEREENLPKPGRMRGGRAESAYRRPAEEAEENLPKPGRMGDGRAESAYRRPAEPVAEEAEEDLPRPGQVRDVKADSVYRRPAVPGTEKTEETEEAEEGFRIPDAPEARMPEPDKNNGVKIPGTDTQRLNLSGTGSAAGTEPAPEGMQRADSRVPEEARRMAAAPYGAGGPERQRPGTRPMAAPPRPAASQKQNGRALARELRKQAAVGYAPGRMNEGHTRYIPTGRELREEAGEGDYGYPGKQNARDYLERRGQPFRDEAAEEAPARPAPRGMRLLVLLLLAAGLVLTGLLILRNRNGGNTAEDVNRVISFEEIRPEGAVVSTDVTYSVLTTKDVSEIRLVDNRGQAVPIKVAGAGNADGNAFMITLNMENDFEGMLRLEIRGEDGKWQPTGNYSSQLSLKGVPSASPEAQGADSVVTLPPEAQEWITSPPEEAGMPEETAAPEAAGVPEDEAGENGGEDDEGAEEEGVGEEAGDPGNDEAFREAGELRTMVPTHTPVPEDIVKPTETPPLTVEAAPEANPDIITNVTVYAGSRKQKDYNRPLKELIHMPEADRYTLDKIGVLTFRGDNFRRNAGVGPLTGAATGLSMGWEVEGGSSRGVNQTYYGYGWPGQPAIVKWSKQIRPASNLYESKQEKKLLKEVIIAGLDGNIRFLDLDDGSLTRNSIKLGYPMSATPSLHTVGQPYMTVGQFARKMKVKTGRIGLRQYNLYNQKELKLIDGLDTKHRRPLNNIGSFETSALIDRTSDTLITAGSNGMLYLEALNSAFDWKVGVMNVSLSETTMTSRAKGQKNTSLTAVESSLAAYDKYVYYADMGGVLRCVDTNTLRPVWAAATGDAVMAAVALDLT